MKVVIDERSGFCFGVVKAITGAEEALNADHKVYSLGDIVHNKIEMSRLEKRGLETVDHTCLPQLSGQTVLIRAHGEPPSTYQMARQYGIRLIDATCPVVAKLQERVKAAYQQMQAVNGQVVILGKRGHAEVAGLTGQTEGKAIVIESIDDLDAIDFSRPIYLVSQTTQSLSSFQQVTTAILENAAERGNSQVTIRDTICRQVSNREPHLKDFSARYDVVFFVSGKESSNGKALYRVCKEANPKTYKIETANEIQAQWLDGASSVGICGATSTPKWLMEQVAQQVRDRYTHK